MPEKCRWYCVTSVLLCLLLAGCSGQFLFRNIDWFVRDYVDDYVSLTDAQEEILDEEVHRIQRWMIHHAVAEYIRFLDQLSGLNPAEISSGEFSSLRQQTLVFTRTLMKQAAPAITRLSETFTPEQSQQFISALHQRHHDLNKKYLFGTAEELREKAEKRIRERLETWLGDLTPEQNQTIRVWINHNDMNSRTWRTWQHKLEAEAQSLMDQRKKPASFQARLNDLLQNTESYYPPGFRRLVEHNQRTSQTYLLQIIHQMTPAQTKHFRQEIQDWKDIALEIQNTVIK
ncbi:hypothetical protein VA7868_02301 [Vibrio aerogenes CECT 7868]|uniref:Lipoprotein n=1 Tax=Vibrio aerogenes CECT 7868 TaxID=1216006 RepID=A0A1M5Z4Y1_9VIBR|nr:DUF6279 family lipoprotein [Vibrio aerogenes]SHI19327.1 hypothetical protein VA7868_02301 [Vibrio aerogenes CECT 7868]